MSDGSGHYFTYQTIRRNTIQKFKNLTSMSDSATDDVTLLTKNFDATTNLLRTYTFVNRDLDETEERSGSVIRIPSQLRLDDFCSEWALHFYRRIKTMSSEDALTVDITDVVKIFERFRDEGKLPVLHDPYFSNREHYARQIKNAIHVYSFKLEKMKPSPEYMAEVYMGTLLGFAKCMIGGSRLFRCSQAFIDILVGDFNKRERDMGLVVALVERLILVVVQTRRGGSEFQLYNAVSRKWDTMKLDKDLTIDKIVEACITPAYAIIVQSGHHIVPT
jgi:hypothetical protein